MAGFNYAQNIIGLKKGAGDIHELEVEVANLSASVLSIGEDVHELDVSVANLSASVLPMGSTDSTKIKDSIIQKYPNLNITSTQGTETNKATLYASGNIGFVTFAFACKSTTQEEIVVELPTGWKTVREGVVIRDNDNGNLVSVYVGSGGNLTTFNHVGTMTVGHLFFASMKAYKE